MKMMKIRVSNQIQLSFLIGILIGFGFLMLASASIPFSLARTGDALALVKRDLVYLGVGIALMLLTAFQEYRVLKKLAVPGLILSFLLLLLVFFFPPHIGAHRWIFISGFSFQVAELVKLSMILYLATALSGLKEKEHLRLRVIVILMFALILLLLEPFRSAAFIIFSVAVILLFSARQYRSLAIIPVLFILLLGAGIQSESFLSRFSAVLNPWHYYYDLGYQTVQSLIAIGHNGLLGAGYGLSSQKWMLLPDAHSEAIFPVIAEELGIAGVLLLFLLLLSLAFLGGKVAKSAPDQFGSYLAIGITSLFTIQALLHIGSCLGLLPFGSVPLPLFSYGGSNLVFTLIGLGILLSIARSFAPEPESNNLKTKYFAWLVVIVFLILFARVFYLQAFKNELLARYANSQILSSENRDAAIQ